MSEKLWKLSELNKAYRNLSNKDGNYSIYQQTVFENQPKFHVAKTNKFVEGFTEICFDFSSWDKANEFSSMLKIANAYYDHQRIIRFSS